MRDAPSAASRMFAFALAAALTLTLLVGALLVLEGRHTARIEAERVTQAVAQSLAATDDVRDALAAGDADAATALLQPFAREVMASARVDFITIMTPAGTRLTHADPARIGGQYVGTIPDGPVSLTEEFRGTLGPSLRTIAPVLSGGTPIGWVSAGVTLETVQATILSRLPIAAGIAAGIAVLGVGAAVLVRRFTWSVTGDRTAAAIRDTLASTESMRTLGEALRAQTHEHGNRIHTAVALLEMGETDRAIALLTDSAAHTQHLVDEVAIGAAEDPTLGALLLGKASQARERGIEWSARVEAPLPRFLADGAQGVALVGNLVDNALDAAAEGGEPRWVRVSVSPTPEGEIRLDVADSGPGIPDALSARVFERGFSTKPAGAEGRGIGLTLVRAIVDDAGGSLRVTAAPTTFRVVLPQEAP